MLLNFLSYPSCNILEIGVFVGTSVIGMLQYLPDSTAVVLDNWEEQSNAEDIFYTNIKVANMESRIKVFKNQPYLYLISQKNKTFDFINVNGNIEDLIIHCLLSWKLLNKNGILSISKFEKHGITNETFTKKINHFLDKIKLEYSLLDNEFNFFIKKIN